MNVENTPKTNEGKTQLSQTLQNVLLGLATGAGALVGIEYMVDGESGILNGDPIDEWFKFDSDGDGVTDNIERKLGLDPKNHDSNTDGISDFFELYGREKFEGEKMAQLPDSDHYKKDLDGDSIYDLADMDKDGDGLKNLDEIILGTSDILKDSDGDGVHDGDEVLVLERKNGMIEKFETFDEQDKYVVWLPYVNGTREGTVVVHPQNGLIGPLDVDEKHNFAGMTEEQAKKLIADDKQ
jgi:hypothetical protein